MQSRSMAMPQKLRFPNLARAKAGLLLKKYKLPILILLIHAPLGVLLRNSGTFAAVHAYALLLFGLYMAVRKQKSLTQVAFVAAYIVSAEVIWRMAEAPIYWEFGKYAAGLIMVTALVMRNKWKVPHLPVLYLVFLLPACFLTLINDGFADAKDKLSFNMSGPILLVVGCWFFSHIKIDWLGLRKILFWLIIPLFSIAITTLFYTVSSDYIVFTGESNHRTSGGFGPNQVSAMLGLGVFLCLVCYLLFKNRLKEKLLFGVLIVFFAAQSIMTFSRGGIYNAGGAILAVLFFQTVYSGKGVKQFLAVALIAVIFMMTIFPQMNAFTGGALQARFESTDSTGRLDIIAADFHIFTKNPVMGIGVGEAFRYREQYFGKPVAAHTEFTRMISEHGVFGIFSLLMLMLIAVFAVMRQKNHLGKALAAGFIAWSFLFMLNTGMRLAAPSFVCGLSFVLFVNLPARRKPQLKMN